MAFIAQFRLGFEKQIKAALSGQTSRANDHGPIRLLEQLRLDQIGTFAREMFADLALFFIVETIVNHVKLIGPKAFREAEHLSKMPVEEQPMRKLVERFPYPSLWPRLISSPSVR